MSEPFQLDERQIRRAFGRAASSYEDYDVLEREVQQDLLSRLDFYLDTPGLVVDLGTGTGRGAALLKQRYRKAQVLAIDIALPMLRRARRRSRRLRPIARIAAEATRLPLADHCVDVLHANWCFQWINDLMPLFRECARVLKPGGFLAFSMPGPDTLRELRAAWAAHDECPHVGRFLDMHDVGDVMIAAELYDPVLDVARLTLTYETPEGLLRDLKGTGATNADARRRRGLTGKQRYRRMLETYASSRTNGRVAATFEIVTAHAWARREGQRLRLPIGLGVPNRGP